MKISILIICYNQENYISQCIDSIIIQRIPYEYEVIVADDYSDDSTLSIIKDKLFGKAFTLNVLENSKNLGISKNYQRGFAQCKGEYIAIIEGDDYWTDPNRLLKHINFLDNHRECVMSMNRYIEYKENSNTFSHLKWNFSEDYKYITTQDMASGNKLGNLSACVLRKSEVEKIKPNLFDLDIADWMLGMVLSQNGFISILKELMSVRRIHDKGEWSKMSSQKSNKILIEHIDIYNQYFEYKYDKEFSLYKRKINKSSNSKSFNYHIVDFIPPIIVIIFKILLPKVIFVFIKKLFVKIFR